MYGIHYVVGRDSDQPIDKETSVASDLAIAISSARQKIKNTNIAIPANPTQPHPIGFLIFDSSGAQLLHREYLD
jgi:hypothetical protein